MSVRAYLIKQIKTEKDATFNCWHDTDIFELADGKFYNDGGYLTFNRDEVEEEIEKWEATKVKKGDQAEAKKENLEILNKILNDTKANPDGFAEYLCY